MSYEYADFTRLENDTRFIKVFELLMEISEKSNTLNKVVKGNYQHSFEEATSPLECCCSLWPPRSSDGFRQVSGEWGLVYISGNAPVESERTDCL